MKQSAVAPCVSRPSIVCVLRVSIYLPERASAYTFRREGGRTTRHPPPPNRPGQAFNAFCGVISTWIKCGLAVSAGRPTVRFNGREMLLHSNRDGRGRNFDLFVSTRRNRHDAWVDAGAGRCIEREPHARHPSVPLKRRWHRGLCPRDRAGQPHLDVYPHPQLTFEVTRLPQATTVRVVCHKVCRSIIANVC